VSVERVAWSRRRHVGVLRRRPRLDTSADPLAPPPGVRRVDQVRALVDLHDRGLLSEEELEHQQAKVFGRSG
jgi:hypothetical protein